MANAFGATTFLAQIAIFAATVALLVSFLIAQQASRFGPAVAQRFLERGDVIPPGNAPLNAANLAAWVHDPDNAASVKGYARTVISIDIVFLLAFGTFLATAARFVAERVDWRILDAASLWWWALAILPGLYVIADFFEDILIVHLLENPDAIPGRFDLLRKVTSWKMRTSIGSFAQLAILFAALFALGSSPPLSTP
jgi:hypothetical protein